MTQPAQLDMPVAKMDPAILARLTGGLGDDRTMGKICRTLGQVFCDFLPDILANDVGIQADIAYAGFETGRKEDLIAGLGSALAFSNGSLRNWCDDFLIACDSPFIIATVENMLGAESDSVLEPAPRELSDIELDVTSLIFDKIAGVLRSAVSAPGGFEPQITPPYNASDRIAPPDEKSNVFSALVNMSIGIGPVLSTFCIIVPQGTLLKTVIAAPTSAKVAPAPRSAWSDQLGEHVRRSQVTLEACIALESLTLGTISRLQAGDVIPFKEAQDVQVQVNANGKSLYVCEFGRSGAQYTVRVKDMHGSETDILKHLMG